MLIDILEICIRNYAIRDRIDSTARLKV